MKKVLTLMFVMLLAVVLVGCGGSGDATIQNINVSGSSTVKVGESQQYQAKFTPEDYPDQSVTWSTSDETALTIDQNGKATGVAAKSSVYIYAKSNADANAEGKKKVVVKAATEGGGDDNKDYPDLQGYTIGIAQADHALHEMDPFLDGYKSADKEAKQEAWREVEDLFNCKIEIQPYPSYASWGPPRWNYILSQAASGVADFDFYTVPDDKIASFVEGGALISLEEFYVLHGNNMMAPAYYTSGSFGGSLYSLSNADINIDNVMYYNIGLYEELAKEDPTLEEPAKIFMDGNWTFDKFESYCKQVQDAMAKAFGDAGVANSENQEYFAVSGWDSYWWVGLATNDGEPIADTTSMTINLTTPHKTAAAEVVKNLYSKGYAAKSQGVDQGVTQWNDGKALFNTGSLWFVNADNRWSSSLWGAGETRYGYIPWPRANDVKFDDIKVAVGGIATWVMPIGRDYSQYGDDCTPENIYWAVAEMLQRSEKYYVESPTYNKEEALRSVAGKYAHSEASVEAYIHIQNIIEAGMSYYDPMVGSENPVGSLYNNSASRTTVKGAVTQYCTGNTISTWAEAIAPLLPVLQEALTKAYN